MVTKQNSQCRWILDLEFPDNFTATNDQFPITYTSDTDSSVGTCDRTLYYNLKSGTIPFDPSFYINRFGTNGTVTRNLDRSSPFVSRLDVDIYLSEHDVALAGATTQTGLDDWRTSKAFTVEFFRILPGQSGITPQQQVRVFRLSHAFLDDYIISVFSGDDDEALPVEAFPPSRVSVADVQVWLNESMLKLDAGDTLPESVEVERTILGRMASRFDVSSWRDSTTTPPLIKVAIAKLIASRRFRTLYASRDGEQPRYAFDLEEEVWGRGRDGGVIGDILNGSIDLLDDDGNPIPPTKGYHTISSPNLGEP